MYNTIKIGHDAKELVDNYLKETNIEQLQKTYTEKLEKYRIDTNNYFNKLGKNSTSEDFANLISHFREVSDLKQGIVQVVNGQLPILGTADGSKSPVIIRDCRLQYRLDDEVVSQKPGLIPESWMAVITGQAKGAVKLIEMYCSEDLQPAARGKVVDLLTQYKDQLLREHITEDQLKDITHQFTLALVDSYDIFISKDEFAIARDFANFDDNHEHLVTIASNISSNSSDQNISNNQYPVWGSLKVAPLSERTIREEYLPLQKLSKDEQLKQALRSRHRNEVSLEEELVLGPAFEKTPIWFQNLSNVTQDLIINNYDKIIDNKHFIPTQLRNVPGLRNAYLDIRGVTQNNELTDIYPEFHSGTLSQFASEPLSECFRLTTQNINRLAELAGGRGQSLSIEALNTEFDFTQGWFHNFVAAAMGEESRICDTLSEAHTFMPKEERVSDKVKLNITATNEAARYNKIAAMSSLAKKSVDASKSQEQVVYMCKSGKDRTGMVILNNFGTFLEDKDFNNDLAYKSLVNSNHVEFLAGHHGATRGIAGLKAAGVFAGLDSHPLSKYKDRFASHIAEENNIRGFSIIEKCRNYLSNGIEILKEMLKDFISNFQQESSRDSNKDLNNNEEPPKNINSMLMKELKQKLGENLVQGNLKEEPKELNSTKSHEVKGFSSKKSQKNQEKHGFRDPKLMEELQKKWRN